MEKVLGVGGVFLRCPDPARTARWYRDHLGLAVDESWHGCMFGPPEAGSSDTGQTVWSCFTETGDYFPASQPVMLNFRVADRDAMLAQLQAAGVRVDEKRMDEPYGKFGWFFDCDGRKVELWQPVATPPA